MTEKTKPIAQLVAGEEYCLMCGQPAEIFQTEGNFCLECWQVKTMPNITIR